MKLLSGLIKKSITLIISPYSPYLLIACFFINPSSFSSGTELIKSVFTGVGPIALTVIPILANSLARICVRLITAALEEAYMATPSSFNGTATVANLIIIRIC